MQTLFERTRSSKPSRIALFTHFQLECSALYERQHLKWNFASTTKKELKLRKDGLKLRKKGDKSKRVEEKSKHQCCLMEARRKYVICVVSKSNSSQVLNKVCIFFLYVKTAAMTIDLRNM